MNAILLVRRVHDGIGYVYLRVGWYSGRPIDLPMLCNVTDESVQSMLQGEELVLSFDLKDATHPSGRYGYSALFTWVRTRVYVINSSITGLSRVPAYLPEGRYKIFPLVAIRQIFEHRNQFMMVSFVSVNTLLQAAEQFGKLNLYLSDPIPRAIAAIQHYQNIKLDRFYYWIKHGKCPFPGLVDMQEITSRMQAMRLVGGQRFATVDPAEVCSICLAPITDRMFVCGHGFHADCLDQWKRTAARTDRDRVMKCPYCRGQWKFAMVAQ